LTEAGLALVVARTQAAGTVDSQAIAEKAFTSTIILFYTAAFTGVAGVRFSGVAIQAGQKTWFTDLRNQIHTFCEWTLAATISHLRHSIKTVNAAFDLRTRAGLAGRMTWNTVA